MFILQNQPCRNFCVFRIQYELHFTRHSVYLFSVLSFDFEVCGDSENSFYINQHNNKQQQENRINAYDKTFNIYFFDMFHSKEHK